MFEGEDVVHDVDDGALQALVDSGEAQARAAQGRRHPRRPAAAGCSSGWGARDEFDPERARVAAAVALGRARELGTRSLCWELPHHMSGEQAAAFVEGTLLAAYEYRAYKSAAEDEDGDRGSPSCCSPPTTT